MGWVSGLLVYALIWSVVLFTVLPWGVKLRDRPEPGHATSAPENPRLWLKMAATSAFSLVIWLAVYAVMASGLISFRAG